MVALRGALINVAKSKSSATPVNTKDDNPISKYFKETRAELRKVTWPTRDESINLTIIIVTVTVVVAIFLGLLDFLFQEVVSGILLNNFVWIAVAIVLFVAGASAFYFNSQQE